jgi:hypothetical protein
MKSLDLLFHTYCIEVGMRAVVSPYKKSYTWMKLFETCAYSHSYNLKSERNYTLRDALCEECTHQVIYPMHPRSRHLIPSAYLSPV